MSIDKRINYRDAGYVSQAYGSRSKSSAPTRSSPFSGNESRQQYSAKQTMTGAVKGGGPRGPDKKFTTSFVDPQRGRDSRDEFIRDVQKTNPTYTGGPSRDNFLTRAISGGINYAKRNPLQILLSAINPVFGAAMLGANFLNKPEFRKRFTGYETQAEYDQARQDRINRNRIGVLENTIQKKYLDKGRSLTETDLDERLAGLKSLMGIQDTAPNVMTARDENLRGIQSVANNNFLNTIGNVRSNIDKLSNIPNIQELYERDRILSGMDNFTAPPGQSGVLTGINTQQLPGNNLRTEVTQQDINASKMRGFNMMDRQTAIDLGMISPNVTDYEFEQLQQGNITQPGTYVG